VWPSSSWARVDPSSTTRSPRHSLCEQLRRLVINMIRGSSYGTAWYSNVSVTVRRFLFSRIQGDHNIEHHWSKWGYAWRLYLMVNSELEWTEFHLTQSHRSDLQRGPGGWGGRKASTLPAEVWTGCSQKRVSKTVTERQFQMFQYVPEPYSERLQVLVGHGGSMGHL
jgi:hypothetical protein